MTVIDMPRGNRHRRAWTHETIVAAIHTWAEETGKPPAATDWNPARARHMAHAALSKARDWNTRISLFEAGGYPSADTVRREFGSFSAGLEAAGCISRPVGRTPNDLTDQQIAALKKRDMPGTPSQLAASFKAVYGAQHAKDPSALRAALFDLAATAMAWCERIIEPEQQEAA